jgi:hypothetical protein
MRENMIGWIAGSMYFGGILLLDLAGAGLTGISLFVVMFSLLLFVLVSRLAVRDDPCDESPERRSGLDNQPSPC